LNSGANPTIVSYNATNSMARFENKNYFFQFKNALVKYNAGVVGSCKFKSRRLAPGPYSEKCRRFAA
jgi:hypothetical protein